MPINFSDLGGGGGGGGAFSAAGKEIVTAFALEGGSFILEAPELEAGYTYSYTVKPESSGGLKMWEFTSPGLELVSNVYSTGVIANTDAVIPMAEISFPSSGQLFVETTVTGVMVLERSSNALPASVATTDIVESSFGGLTYTGPYYTHMPSQYNNNRNAAWYIPGMGAFVIAGNNQEADYVFRISDTKNPGASRSNYLGSTYYNISKVTECGSFFLLYYQDGWSGSQVYRSYPNNIGLPYANNANWGGHNDLVCMVSGATLQYSRNGGTSFTAIASLPNTNQNVLCAHNGVIYLYNTQSREIIFGEYNEASLSYDTWVSCGILDTTSIKINVTRDADKVFFTRSGAATYQVLDLSTKELTRHNFPHVSYSGTVTYLNGVFFHFPNIAADGMYHYSSDGINWTTAYTGITGYIADAVATPDGVFAFVYRNENANILDVSRTIQIG